jgi:hypothetical protein
LLQLVPDIPGELKSQAVFDDLSFRIRTQIWTTLRAVVIHVVDPRPYKSDADSMLRIVLKRDDAPEAIRLDAFRGDLLAQRLHQNVQMYIAESILVDSVPARAFRAAQSFSQDLFMMARLGPSERFAAAEIVTIKDLYCRPKSMVKKATEFSAKAAAAFHESMDVHDAFSKDHEFYFSDPTRRIINKMLRPLRDLHAFDKGDDQQMRALETVRGRLIASMTDADNSLSRMQRLIPLTEYVDFDSKNTALGQAADLAAGIASALFERNGIAGLVTRFEHVTYNGKRTSEADIARITHKLGRL